MSKQTPAGAAARAATLVIGMVTLGALSILGFFGAMELNFRLAIFITGQEAGYGVAAVLIALIGIEVAIVAGACSAVAAYRSVRDE